MHARVCSSLVLAPLILLLSCDLSEPTDRQYNAAAHPPSIGSLQTLGIGSEPLAGQVFFVVDSTIGLVQAGDFTLILDDQPVTNYWTSQGLIGFDTRAFAEGGHMLVVGLMKPGGGPRETGLLGYLGVPDLLFAGGVGFQQTSPVQLPAQPFVPWDDDLRQRPAVDVARNTLYVLERDSVKAFSTYNNALLRSRRLTGTSFSSVTALRHFALSADGTRLYVYAVVEFASSIISLNALTFDSLAAAPVSFPVYGIACGDAGRMYVSSAPVSAPSGAQGIIRVVSTATLAQSAELAVPLTAPMAMVISNDRNTLYLASNGICRLSVGGGAPTLQIQKVTHQVISLGLSPDGLRLFQAWNQDFGYSSTARVTIRSATTLDSTGFVQCGPTAANVWDLLPSGGDLFAVVTVWEGSPAARVAKFSNLAAMTASWDFGSFAVPVQLQVSGDGRFLYVSGGAMCIPIP
jgi:hypothetical protein